jgi:hypothetical protein
MKKVKRLSLLQHLEEVTSQLLGEKRRRRIRGLNQTRHPLFVTIAREDAITL